MSYWEVAGYVGGFIVAIGFIGSTLHGMCRSKDSSLALAFLQSQFQTRNRPLSKKEAEYKKQKSKKKVYDEDELDNESVKSGNTYAEIEKEISKK